MSKKILLPMIAVLMVALLAGMWVIGDAQAQGDTGRLGRLRRARPTLGQVTAVSDDQFTVQTRDGESKTFLVDENTRVRSKEAKDLTLSDLQVGRWVGVVAPRSSNEQPLARLIVLLPEDFDPEQVQGARGRVTEVDIAAQAFTLENRKGEAVTLKVDDNTKFMGEAADLAGLEDGMLAGAVTHEQGNGDLLATLVRSGNPQDRRQNRQAGEVLSVDESAGQFTLKALRSGEETTFAVDENTRFRSKDGKLESLKDLKPGMVALVMARPDSEGETPVAALVAASDKDNLPKFDKRVAGKVVAVGADSFTIQTRDGQQISFQVTRDTQFRSKGGQVASLEDLQEGMIVLVGAKKLSDGKYQAQMVAAGKLPAR
jgi:hypothetical protein